jgi:hypothetical protein
MKISFVRNKKAMQSFTALNQKNWSSKNKKMKILVPHLSFLVVLIIISASCKKEKKNITYPSAPPQVSVIGNREYFYGISWEKDSNGYVMNLDPQRLTDTAINR